MNIIDRLATEDTIRIETPGAIRGLLEVSLHYDLGSSRTRRGYYIHLTPMDLEDGIIRIVVSEGVRMYLSPAPVTRKSARARREALEMLTQDLLIDLMYHSDALHSAQAYVRP